MEALSETGVTLEFFTSPDCGCCGPVLKQLRSAVDEWGADADIDIRTVDVTKSPSAADEKHVTMLPTILAGEMRLVGSSGYDDVRSFVMNAVMGRHRAT